MKQKPRTNLLISLLFAVVLAIAIGAPALRASSPARTAGSGWSVAAVDVLLRGLGGAAGLD